MKLSTIVLILIGGIAAIAVGWIYQSQQKTAQTGAELEIPVDIDYYLSRLKLRVMADSGKLDYELRSPYLQHFKRDDISRIETPEIDIYRKQRHWQLEAKNAEMHHQQEILYLIDDVMMLRTGDDPMQLNSPLLRFESSNDLIVGESGIRIAAKNVRIDAETAVFDLENNVYSLTNTKAIYHDEQS